MIIQNWYIYVINTLTVIFVLFMTRRMIYRGRFFLHIFQLEGYKTGEFWQWMKKHWQTYILTLEHGLMNLVVLLLFIFFRTDITRTASTIIIAIFGLFWMAPVSVYRVRQKKPFVMTPRMIRLTVLFTVFGILLPFWGSFITYKFSFLYLDIYVLAFTWVIGDIFLPFFLLLSAFLLYPVEWSVQQHFKKMARDKVRSMSDLKVIAITGSYGKTSTKFMIRDILKERYNVLATPGSFNTPMGICKIINNDLKPQHQILILEMGARYKGNIKELCQIAQPDISVVTNVGLAHLETFGSQRAIQETKAEIIENLAEGGLAVLNSDDTLVTEMAERRTDIKVVRAGLLSGDTRAKDISYGADGCRFNAILPDGEEEVVQTSLLGKHNVENLLLAIGVGHQLGLRLKTMAVAISKIAPVEHRLELKSQNGVMVIDDAFNSNPVGAKNAVEILSHFDNGRRIIVTPGMVELGAAADDENRKFGHEIGEANLDQVILVGPKQTEPIQEGIRDTGYDFDKVRIVHSLFEANDFLKDFIKEGDIILYENDLPDTYNE